MSQNANRQACSPRKGIIICTPLGVEELPNGNQRLQMVSSEWHHSRLALCCPTGFAMWTLQVNGLPIAEARNVAVKEAIKQNAKYIFFLDSDVIVPPEGLKQLTYHLNNNPDVAAAAMLYTSRSHPPEPFIWQELLNGVDYDWTFGDVVECQAGTATGAMLIRMDIFDELPYSDDNPWFKFAYTETQIGADVHKNEISDDLWFCRRIKTETNKRIIVDTALNCAHFDASTGIAYTMAMDSLPVKRRIERDRLNNVKELVPV